MATQYVMQRDTAGWRTQVWLSFGLAVGASAVGVLMLPGQELDRAFLAIGLFFCLFASFAVAKTVRDNRDGQVDTGSWVMTVWVAFAAAFSLTAWGLWRMNIGEYLAERFYGGAGCSWSAAPSPLPKPFVTNMRPI